MQLNNAIGSEGASPIIRVPWAEEWMIKRALDSGAHGIMTPMCHTAVRSDPKKRGLKYLSLIRFIAYRKTPPKL